MKVENEHLAEVTHLGVLRVRRKGREVLAPSGRVAVMPAFHQVLLLTFRANLEFGKSSPAEVLRRINNEDKETGILKRTKKELCGALKQAARVTSTLLGEKQKKEKNRQNV